jgi:hypothetical protein
MVTEGKSDDDRAQLILPQLRMDDLLNELQARLQAVVSTRDRVHSLLEAVVSIGSDLDLETVHRRIIEAATRLVDARYGLPRYASAAVPAPCRSRRPGLPSRSSTR